MIHTTNAAKKCEKCMFTHTVESTVCDESPKKKVDDTQGRRTSYTVDSTVCVNIEKLGGLGWTWSPGRIPPPPTTSSDDVTTSGNVPPKVRICGGLN